MTQTAFACFCPRACGANPRALRTTGRSVRPSLRSRPWLHPMTVMRPIGMPTPETARPRAATKRPGNATSAPRSATRSSPISPRQLAQRGNPPRTIGPLRPRTAATPEATAAPPPATASGDATHAVSLQIDRTSAAIPHRLARGARMRIARLRLRRSRPRADRTTNSPAPTGSKTRITHTRSGRRADVSHPPPTFPLSWAIRVA